jgi:S-adenosylmethionine:tRNA ribosyltransferase-isomerase
MTLCTDDFDYPLNPNRIAQEPVEPRDHSRLMRLDRFSGAVEHRHFYELPGLLRNDDLLVVNDTRVIPARFFCRRPTGGRIEGLFLREMRPGRWDVMLKGAARCKEGETLSLDDAQAELTLIENQGQGRWRLGVQPDKPAVDILDAAGRTPLPPYIRRVAASSDTADRDHYQTLYAQRPGAVAAPTAGLHFTRRVLDELSARGLERAEVTLHVGLGTFAPVKVDALEKHPMHSEWYELSRQAATKIRDARAAGRRIVAVGTTSVRVLESAARAGANELSSRRGWTDLFLYPPAEFHVTDALITNFHLPRSTLLMLVAAFCDPGGEAGLETILHSYEIAQREAYRFFSYGDAMLIE